MKLAISTAKKRSSLLPVLSLALFLALLAFPSSARADGADLMLRMRWIVPTGAFGPAVSFGYRFDVKDWFAATLGGDFGIGGLLPTNGKPATFQAHIAPLRALLNFYANNSNFHAALGGEAGALWEDGPGISPVNLPYGGPVVRFAYLSDSGKLTIGGEGVCRFAGKGKGLTFSGTNDEFARCEIAAVGGILF